MLAQFIVLFFLAMSWSDMATADTANPRVYFDIDKVLVDPFH